MSGPPNEMVDVEHSMKSHRRIHEIPERPRVTENWRSLDSTSGTDVGSSTSCSCVTSHRTEDIAVREDEDGIRTHLCPLDEREDSENSPDEAMRAEIDDLDAMVSGGCSLKSEDIVCLMAVGPSTMNSEDNNGDKCSDVDASTSMIYAPTRNGMSIDKDATFFFQQDNQRTMSHQIETLTPDATARLDEETMIAWAGESSDDSEYSINDQMEEERLLPEVSDESDMEEFDETLHAANNRYKNLESSESEETNVWNEQKFDVKKWPCDGTDDGGHKEISQESNSKTDTQNINTEKISWSAKISGQQLDSTESTDQRIDNTEVGGSLISVEENPETEVLKTDTMDKPFLKLAVAETNENENRINLDLMNAAVNSLLCLNRGSNGSSDDGTEDHSKKAESQNEIIAINERTAQENKDIMTEHSSVEKSYSPNVKFSLTGVTDKGLSVAPLTLLPGDVKTRVKYEKKGHLEPTAILQLNETQIIADKPDSLAVQPSRTGDAGKKPLVDPLASLPADIKIKVKDEKRGDLTVEPRVAMLKNKVPENEEPEPDLATALRFMTEVYHSKDEEELYLDTLNFPDTAEVSVERKKSTGVSITPDDLKLPTTSDFKSLCPSSPFEPALTEEQRAVATTRSRNKLSKFFRSFKQRFTKKT